MQCDFETNVKNTDFAIKYRYFFTRTLSDMTKISNFVNKKKRVYQHLIKPQI